MSTDLDGFLAVAEDVLGQMKEVLPRLDRHYGFMPAGPVSDRAAVVLDLFRQAVTDIDAALQKWDDLDREQEEYDREDEAFEEEQADMFYRLGMAGGPDDATWDEVET